MDGDGLSLSIIFRYHLPPVVGAFFKGNVCQKVGLNNTHISKDGVFRKEQKIQSVAQLFFYAVHNFNFSGHSPTQASAGSKKRTGTYRTSPKSVYRSQSGPRPGSATFVTAHYSSMEE